MNAGQIHNMFHHEYLELTDAEKVELADRHKKERDAPVIRRDTPRARVQDFANTVHNMEKLVYSSPNIPPRPF
jgi:hypothetical protein